MCYSAGSLDQAINPCPMCKVYPHTKCPHIRARCSNRTAHPRMDVLYLTNAEVDRFNGCGYCKWADSNPPSKAAGYNNRGWPGCCRAPSASEYPMIQIAEWKAVSIVHRVPIPPDVDKVLSSIHLPPLSKGVGSLPSSPTGRGTPSKPSTPSSSRRNTTTTTPSKSNVLSTKAMNTPTQPDRARSPHNHASGSASANISRNASSTAISSSVPTASSMEGARRKPVPGSSPDRRAEGRESSQSSPDRRSIDLENPASQNSRRASSARRPVVTPATTSVSVSKVVAADTRSASQAMDSSLGRRSISGPVSASSPTSHAHSHSHMQTTTTTTTPPSSSSSRNKDAFLVPRSSKKEEDCSASSSSGSSDGLGSISDSTITSDGGFTDYLSDESEAELQRQAEARAVVVALNHAEELEFKMARQQLAHIGLKPPKSWNPTNTPAPSPTKTAPAVVVGGGATRGGVPAASFASAAAAMLQPAPEARV